ncbi:FtsW/RodA/SpoVE family cell cycle protein, partial [Streptomyces alboverticillatus]
MTGVTVETVRVEGGGDSGVPAAAFPPGSGRRLGEAVLLVLAVLTGCSGYAYTGLATAGEVPAGLPAFAGVMACLALFPHLAVRQWAPHADPLILPLAVLLSALGLVLLYRLDPAYARRYDAGPTADGQLVWTVLGVVLCVVVVALLPDHRRLRRYIHLTMAVALVLLMAPAFFPGDLYGAKRWILIGPLSFQPGEFVKIMIAVFFAGHLVTHRDALALTGRKALGMRLPPGRQLGPIVTVWVLSLLVLALERDLGTSLIFFGLFVVMLYAATERTGWVVCGLLMAV